MDKPTLAAVRLFLTWIINVVSPGGTVRIGPGTVAAVPAVNVEFSRAKPHMGIWVTPSGRRSVVAAARSV